MPAADRGRVDPETGEELRPGVLARAELRAALAEIDRRWREKLADPEKRPDIPGQWVWISAGIGWCRRKEGKGKG